MSTAANADEFTGSKEITAEDRLQALLLAKMNDEKAELCTTGQPALRTFFEMNSKFLMRIAE